LALIAFALDRIHKYIQIEVIHWPENRFEPITPFFDIGLVYNTGISYSLLSSMPVWVLGLLTVAALTGLAIWWWRAEHSLVRAGLAIAIGGAASNGLDRWIYGGVADFF